MGGRIRLIGALALALGLLLVAAPAIAQGDSSVDRARQWLDQQRKPDGSFDDGVFNPVDLTSNAVMGELAAGSSPAQATLTWLRDSSAAAAYARKGPGATAKLALALESAGRGGSAAARGGVGFLDGQQFDSAGWGYDKRSKDIKSMDANSTGLVLSALSALGIDQQAKAKGGVTPREALLRLQAPAGGFAFDPGKLKAGTADQLATAQALVGLAGRSLPVERPVAAKSPAAPNHTLQIVLATLAGVAVLAAGLGAGTPAWAAEAGGRAALIVEVGQTVRRLCVGIARPAVSGKELVEASGLE